jgi:hypothetical protein
MATDALLALQAKVTKALTFNGAALTLAAGTPRWPLVARVIYSAATSTGSDTLTFSVDVSYDAGSTWNSDFVAPAVAITSTAKSGELFIPFSISPTSVANGTQVRLTATMTTNGTTSVTYQGDIQLARP